MRRLRALERRTQLLAVATQLFAERGFDATTTAAIAAAAEVSEPILYRHFKSKQDLFVAIVSEVTHTTQQHWIDRMQGITDPAEAMRVIFAEWPGHMRACAKQYQVIHNALVSSRDPTVVAQLRTHYRQMEEFFTQLVCDSQKRGVFRDDVDPKTAAWWMMNAGIGFTLIGLTLGEVDGYRLDQAIDMTLRGLRGC
jgi:AcrR family transcriptional regulator